MSLNRVLNRPMFRREALRQGAIKPIRAKVGIYAQGPAMQQGPQYIPYTKYPFEYQGPQGRSFAYDPQSGQYLTGYGKGKIKSGTANLARGLTGLYALYEGAKALGIPDPLLQTAGFAELASLPLGMAKSTTARTVGNILGSGTRFSASNPIGAIGIGGLMALTGGTKSYFDERKMVKDYAKANNISEKKAMDIFNRDLSFGGQRPMTTSDIGKIILAGSSARNVVAGGLDKTPEGPPGSKSAEQRIAGEMRQYMSEAKQYGRYFQDVDELVQKVKDKDRAIMMAEETASMSPDDAMQLDSVTKQRTLDKNIAIAELRNALMAQKNLDVNKATNLALAITEGDINPNNVDEIVKSDELYAQVPNRGNDPKHPKFVKEEKTAEEIVKKGTPDGENAGGDGISSDTAGGTGTGTKQQPTGDSEIDEAKKAADTIDMTQFLRADPRKTEMDPQRVFLMKLAAGLLSGKTMRGGFAGLAEVFGTALGPAVDAKILVKMKNDEAYRDWASTVLSYNTDLLELRNEALKDALDAQGKSKVQLGSFERGGQFFEAKQDKNTGDTYVYDPSIKDYVLVAPDAGQFYAQKDTAQYADNIRLIADGQLSQEILKEQIALMSTDAGRKAIGGSGVILGFAEVLKNLPGEIKDGLVGSVSSDFSMSQGDLSDAEFEKLQKRTNKVLGKFETKTQKFLSGNPSASEILGKLKVNARTLTYTLANALKDKDRLTNRDLDLIEELTGFLGVEPDEKIVQKYEELLGIVQEKNRLRKNRFYTMGYTNDDINGILNSFGTGRVIQGVNPDAFATDTAALDFLMGNQ